MKNLQAKYFTSENILIYGIRGPQVCIVESRNYIPFSACMLAFGKQGRGLMCGMGIFTCGDHYRPMNGTWNEQESFGFELIKELISKKNSLIKFWCVQHQDSA